MERKHPTKILIVDDEEKIRGILAAILGAEGYEVATAADGQEALEKGRSFRPDLLIVDLQMPRMDGIETMVRFRELSPRSVAIILTAHGSIQSAVQAIKEGAYDYLTKPFDNDQLLMIVRRGSELVRLSGEVERLREKLGAGSGPDALMGEGRLMQELRTEIRRIAAADATVLIQGESGTGKELAARAIHSASMRKDQPLIVVDCTAIPEQLVETSFFGHERGAFTDAGEQTSGAFEEADGGTVFLDEISELPGGAQAKLLRVIQEKEFARVGSSRPLRVDVRVIAATNRDLRSLVGQGKFREDLFYRLNVLTLRMPPLRDHPEDIPLYAAHFVEKYRGIFRKKVSGLSPPALRALLARAWNGNVRELENTVQRALLNASGDRLEESDFAAGAPLTAADQEGWDATEGLEPYVRKVTEHTERDLIRAMLDRTGWNRTETAHRLRISRKTLFNKMQHYGLEKQPGDPPLTE